MFLYVWVYYAAYLNLYQPVLLLLQHNLEGWSQPVITQLHRWAAPQFFVSAHPLGSHRHSNQCILHHIHLCGHFGERSGLGFLQGSPISAHITHRFQKASWADAQRCPTSPHGCAQHDEDRSFFPRFPFISSPLFHVDKTFSNFLQAGSWIVLPKTWPPSMTCCLWCCLI